MIAFNTVLLTPFADGIATYIQNLLRYFELSEQKDEIIVYLAKDKFKYYYFKINLRLNSTPLPSNKAIKRIVAENFYWRRKVINDSIQLFHSLLSYIPFNLPTKSIVTVHDLKVYQYPETYTKSRRLFLKHAIANSISNSNKINKKIKLVLQYSQQIFYLRSFRNKESIYTI